ncbi:hypothetical protein TWF106_003969 [Orbilia oligospora]|uniref:Uncharacterized protein n=1 Tax=Orbilia oligospora TaxID=2813651 RepID=A0A6G1LSD3_ORBOL|nr:hypothetical protein TWF679_003196 [Orbilia oligospora]KAF3199285.1 hypothetical protein TWF106_003969 [Orbilia oligospora]KAF3202596.1 hypothetical protein TWF191_002912 [Orbilia oligospora]KAF3233172.1 hypothetical protein TWF192_002487 [Orbilia oligospora]
MFELEKTVPTLQSSEWTLNLKYELGLQLLASAVYLLDQSEWKWLLGNPQNGRRDAIDFEPVIRREIEPLYSVLLWKVEDIQAEINKNHGLNAT